MQSRTKICNFTFGKLCNDFNVEYFDQSTNATNSTKLVIRWVYELGVHIRMGGTIVKRILSDVEPKKYFCCEVA